VSNSSNPHGSNAAALARSPGGEEPELTIRDIARALADNWRLIVSTTVAGAIAAYVVTLFLPVYYAGVVRLLPPQHQSAAAAMLSQLGALAGLAGGITGFKQPADLYVGLLKSRSVADRITGRFDLQKLYKQSNADQTRQELAARTKISLTREGLIAVHVEDEEPARAAELANAYAEELQAVTNTLAVSEAAQRRLFFERQLKISKEDLANAEVELKQTQERTGLIRIDEQGRAIIDNIARIRAQITGKEVELAGMRSYATSQNATVRRIEDELTALRGVLSRLEKEKGARNGDIFLPTEAIPKLGLQYIRRYRDVKYYETIYDVIAKQYEIARIDEAKEATVVQVVDKAIVPDLPSWPRTRLIVVISAVAALGLGIVTALFRAALRAGR
jgi:uncharacterized protein involved in exopolysaccharide biosynthesis